MRNLNRILLLLVLISTMIAMEPTPYHTPSLGKASALDPVINRARGYMSKGELQFATHNYGSFIEFEDYASPSGLYKGFQYISDVSFILGVPGRNPDGTVAPWAKRPPYIEGLEYYNTDTLVYWGPTVNESWFDRVQDKKQVDWESVENHLGYLHSGEITAGEVYGGLYTDTGDPYPLLASSDIPLSWPLRINPESGQEERTWPGDWAVVTDPSSPAYGQPIYGRHVGDQDIYMEFDDRLASRDEDMTQGYPMGIHVKVNAHSYGRSYAEDIAFFTVEMINESYKGFPMDINGDGEPDVTWVPITDEDGIISYEVHERYWEGSREAIPGVGQYGFNYEGMYGGFYFDVDSYSRREDGSYTGRSNDDDMMSYDTDYDMAYIWDWDDDSNGEHNLAYSALKLLDTPEAPYDLDLDGDGAPDVLAGESLGLTDWHWFNWYDRPGVYFHETNSQGSCASGDYAGVAGCPGEVDKEAIMFSLMSGDTAYINQPFTDWEWRGIADGEANSSSFDYDSWYFHAGQDGVLNPHFDSKEGLLQLFPDGLDCVFIMSAGPFDLAAGDTTFFSFAVIMADPPDDTETFDTPPDLTKNAEMAQIMYDLRYQGFSPPDAPTVSAVADDGQITLYWDSKAEESADIVTGVKDFEGYKIYKSTDGGLTWGDPNQDRIYNTDQQHVGWKPLAQFDYTQDEDESKYGVDYSGPDPVAPWYNRGSNTGLEHRYIDTDVINGVTYSYAVVAYDIGIDSTDAYTSDNFNWNINLEYLENFRGNSALLPQFVQVTPDARPANAPENWVVNRSEGTRGTGEIEVIPTNPELVAGNTDSYEVSIDALPDCRTPGCTNPYYHVEPTYTVVNTTSGDTILSDLELGITTKFSDVWEGFQFYVSNQEWASVDTVYWEGKEPADSPDYFFYVDNQNFKSPSEYELHWDWDNPNTNILLPNGVPHPQASVRQMPFRIYNISLGEDLNGNGVLDPDEDTNSNGVLDEFREIGISPSQVGISGSSPDGRYSYFRSGNRYSFIEDHVQGYDSTGYTATWFVEMVWDTTRTINGDPRAKHPENGDITVITMERPFEKGDAFTFQASTITEMEEVTHDHLTEVRVVPNPYVVTAGWERDINHKSLHFTHLPDECVIKIFTLSGELVYTILHNDIFSGQEEWNLRTMNRQEVAPGLYVFVVETPNHESFTGKFAIIR